jgi:glycosyltransferase involved in cell wall biosynthesis
MVNARMPETQDRHHDVQGVPVHEVTFLPCLLNDPFLQTFDPRVYRATLAEIGRVQPDLVHIHNVSGASLAVFSACRRLGVPAVSTLHDLWLLCPNNMLYRGDGTLCDPAQSPDGCHRCFRRLDFWANIPWRRQVFAHLVDNVRLFISPSQKLADLHVAAGYDPSRFRVVPNGIQPTHFKTPSDPIVRETAQESQCFQTLLFAGAVVENKGIPTLIDAVPLLSRYIDRFRLIVAGTGGARFMRKLRGFGPSTVKLLGRVPFWEMRALYAMADLTVVPSTCYENSPMVIYESFLAGTPALGSAIGGIPELIQEGLTGYLFPAGDAVSLAEQAAQHFARSTYERRRMRCRCAKHAQAHMTLDRHFERLLQVYQEALET